LITTVPYYISSS